MTTSLPAQLEIDDVTPTTLLLEKRRMIIDVQKSLNTNKEEYARKEAYFQKREEQLQKKSEDLQENLIQFNKFCKDKTDKRNQYLKKAEKERLEKISREQEMKVKQREIMDLTRQSHELETQFKSLEKYENYLENVKQSLEDFPEIEYILKRYKVLSDAEQSLIAKEASSSLELENLRKEIAAFSEQQNTMYIQKNNNQQRLLKELEDSCEVTARFEAELESLLLHESNRAKDLTEICMAIVNITDRSSSIFQHTKIKVKQDKEQEDFKDLMEQRLKVVAQYVSDGRKILHNYKQESSKTNRSRRTRRTVPK